MRLGDIFFGDGMGPWVRVRGHLEERAQGHAVKDKFLCFMAFPVPPENLSVNVGTWLDPSSTSKGKNDIFFLLLSDQPEVV